MTSLMDVLYLVIGTPADGLQGFVLYVSANIIGSICIMFFLKLFLLIAGFTKSR